ncbi:MAG: hypothetical protein VXY93_14220, partial [Pseudomonadota bacterium]|nr:hypothetical protein [Pseudomonadota bacterium]
GYVSLTNDANGLYIDAQYVNFRDRAGSTSYASINSSGNLSVFKDLDVDGHTNLDNVSIAGVSTFSGGAGAITIAADSDIRFTNTSNWSGEHAGKIQYFGNKLYLQGGSNGHQLRNHSGGTVFEIGSTGSCAGMDLTLAQNVTLNGDIDVDGHTNLDNVSIAGVTTFTGDGIFNGGAGAIRIGGACDIRFTSGAWTGESVKLQYHSDKFYWQTGANGWQFRDAAGAATLELSPAGVISGKDLTFSSEIKANNGAGAIRILGGSDIRFNTGN